MKKKECPACAMEVDEKSKVCPICGYEFPAVNAAWKWLAILLLIFLVYTIFFR
jgi:RNA polymerase subunit RPABC4/transcription elongation factor Spt4